MPGGARLASSGWPGVGGGGGGGSLWIFSIDPSLCFLSDAWDLCVLAVEVHTGKTLHGTALVFPVSYQSPPDCIATDILTVKSIGYQPDLINL